MMFCLPRLAAVVTVTVMTVITAVIAVMIIRTAIAVITPHHHRRRRVNNRGRVDRCGRVIDGRRRRIHWISRRNRNANADTDRNMSLCRPGEPQAECRHDKRNDLFHFFLLARPVEDADCACIARYSINLSKKVKRIC